MGWYSKHIMGGDPPEDAMAHIMGKVGRIKDVKKIADKLTAIQDDLIEWAIKAGDGFIVERYVSIQVVGVAMMKYGAKILPKNLKKIIRACDKDSWAKEELERRIYVQDFKSILESYDNETPTEETIDYETRFGVTYEDLVKGKFSSRTAKMALYYIHNEYKDEPWYKDTILCVNSGGYSILMGVVDDEESKNFHYVINNVFGIFEVPILFCDGREMQYIGDEDINKIKYHGNQNYKE